MKYRSVILAVIAEDKNLLRTHTRTAMLGHLITKYPVDACVIVQNCFFLIVLECR